MPTLRLATRGSPLARYQAERIAEALAAVDSRNRAELVIVETTGDARADVPLHAISGEGVFSAAVDLAVAEGRADLAVHSAKDLPSIAIHPALVLASVPERADARDCLVGRPLAEIAPGGTVATGAVRRRAQLGAQRPDLCFTELRGNIARRLDKVPDGGAVVVALCALERLGIAGRAVEVLDVKTMLPQVGQGALALTCRADDDATRATLRALDDTDAHACLRAERAFLARLGAGCDAPVGAYATCVARTIDLEALVAAPDGSTIVRRRASGTTPESLGSRLADELAREAHAAGIIDELP